MGWVTSAPARESPGRGHSDRRQGSRLYPIYELWGHFATQLGLSGGTAALSQTPGGHIMLRRETVRRRTGLVAGRWVRLRYRWRGYLDGRMDLPAVPETEAHRTPTLERLAQQVRREQDAVQARLLEL